MQVKSSKELIENIYEQKFYNKEYNQKRLKTLTTVPSFFLDENTNIVKIIIKEEENYNNSNELSKFYDSLQNKKENIKREININITIDETLKLILIDKYSDIINFIGKINVKHYTQKYFKEKILVELQALEDILNYSIENNLKITINNNVVKSVNNELNIRFKMENINEEYYLILEQSIENFKYILHTNNNIYIYYEDNIYKCEYNFINNEYAVLQVFLDNYINKIVINNRDLTNFLGLINQDIKKKIEIDSNLEQRIKKYIPQKLITKLYLDFNEKNYLIADLKFVYKNIEFNPIDNVNIKVNRNIFEETTYLNKLIKSGFLLDGKNKRFIIPNDDSIYNFIRNDIEEYVKLSEVYTTENFKLKTNKKKEKLGIGVKLNNNLLELKLTNLWVSNEEITEILQKYKINKKYHRLKDGSFVNLQNNEELKFLSGLLDSLDISNKNINDTIYLNLNRSLYLNKLLENNLNVKIDKDEEFKNIISKINSKEEYKNNIPVKIKETLRDYQIEGNVWLRSLDKFNFGGILADDMGLGKTIQILSVLLTTKELEKTMNTSLVIAPSSLTINWKNESEKFAKELKVLIINGNSQERKNKIAKIAEYDLVITSYDLLKRDILEYEKLDYTFRYIIADEAQYIKNNATQNSKSIKRIKAQSKFALTGTPIENSLSELWSIFDFIMPEYLYTYKKFKKEYEIKITKEQDEETLNRLKEIIEPFVLRRTKKEVLKELPDKTTTVLKNEMIEEQQKIYLAYLAQARNELNEEIENKGFEHSRIKILALLTRLRQICCHPSLFIKNYVDGSGKLNQCIELIKEAIQSNHKILLFSGYTSMFNIIEPILKSENINYLKITGNVGIKERFELIEKFNNDENIKLFLISLKAGGTGINLTSADTVIHYDPWWNLSVENQATDRTHRIGQKKKVQVYKLITENSIEEKIYELQQRKKELIDNILSTNVKFISQLSKEEIMRLFEE